VNEGPQRRHESDKWVRSVIPPSAPRRGPLVPPEGPPEWHLRRRGRVPRGYHRGAGKGRSRESSQPGGSVRESLALTTARGCGRGPAPAGGAGPRHGPSWSPGRRLGFPSGGSLPELRDKQEKRTSSSSGGRRPAPRRASSDLTPGKLPNKDRLPWSAEEVEGRRPAKGNTLEAPTSRTQRRIDVSRSRRRVCGGGTAASSP